MSRQLLFLQVPVRFRVKVRVPVRAVNNSILTIGADRCLKALIGGNISIQHRSRLSARSSDLIHFASAEDSAVSAIYFAYY